MGEGGRLKTALCLIVAATFVSASAVLGITSGWHSPATTVAPAENLVLSLSGTAVVSEPGCNAVAFAQLPDESSLFIGRQFIGRDGRIAGVIGPNDCSGGDPGNEAAGKPFNRWALVLNSFDWATKRFHIVKPLIDTSLDPRTGRSRAVITGRTMRGLVIRSAYDPSVVKFGGTTFVAFECTAENGEPFGVQQTSSCLAVYDPRTRSIDMSRATVAVTGDKQGDTYHVASLPRLLSHSGQLYLYWSAMLIRNGKIIRSTARGAQLDVTGTTPFIRGEGQRVPQAFDSASTRVWTTEASAASNVLVNIMSLAPLGNGFFVFAALGGDGCYSPAGSSPGCHRLVIKRSPAPLQQDGFNYAEQFHTGVPTNPHEYALPIVDPQGRWWILGHFIRPPRNGFSERAPAPIGQFWATTSRPSTLAVIPVAFSD